MKLTATKIKRLLKRKLATAVLVSASVAAFATLGDGGKKNLARSAAENVNVRSLSLRTTYNFKSNSLFNTTCLPKKQNFIMLNTVVTYQKGNATFIVPLKKKVLLNKIKFNPAPQRF